MSGGRQEGNYGDITIASKVNQGTMFKCWFLIGYEHLPKNQIWFACDSQDALKVLKKLNLAAIIYNI